MQGSLYHASFADERGEDKSKDGLLISCELRVFSCELRTLSLRERMGHPVCAGPDEILRSFAYGSG